MPADVDVRVERCSLTIRRRRGWSWGAGPVPHLQAALTRIEAVLAEAALEAGVEPDEHLLLEQPVRLELAADAGAATTRASVRALADLLRTARSAQRAAAPLDAAPDVPEPLADAGVGVAGSGAGEPAAVADALGRTLGRWSRSGRLASDVRAWPDRVVHAWLAAIEGCARPAAASLSAPPELAPDVIARIAAALLGDAPSAGAPPRAAAERALVLLAALAATLGDRVPGEATQAAALECAGAVAPEVAPRASAAGAGREVAARATGGSIPAEITGPALPWLVLAELTRIGYADALAATAEAAGLPRGAGILAVALARKLGCEDDVAAVISGGPAELVGDGLDALAAHAGDIVAPLGSWLLTAYAEGRSAGDEVVVSGGICGEARGLLPIAWTAGAGELDAVLAALGRPPVRQGDDFLPLARALAAGSGLPDALERHLGAAAGTGLGLLALDLWRGTSLLALERLGDLQARIRSGDDGVQVAIPRGQRWLDLQAAGRLDAVTIPWLPGGRMELRTW